MTARIDSRDLQAGKEIWIGEYTARKIATIKMVRNGLVFFTTNVRGKTAWDRMTIEHFLKSAIDGSENGEAWAQHHDYDRFGQSYDVHYVGKNRHYS